MTQHFIAHFLKALEHLEDLSTLHGFSTVLDRSVKPVPANQLIPADSRELTMETLVGNLYWELGKMLQESGREGFHALAELVKTGYRASQETQPEPPSPYLVSRIQDTERRLARLGPEDWVFETDRHESGELFVFYRRDERGVAERGDEPMCSTSREEVRDWIAQAREDLEFLIWFAKARLQ